MFASQAKKHTALGSVAASSVSLPAGRFYKSNQVEVK